MNKKNKIGYIVLEFYSKDKNKIKKYFQKSIKESFYKYIDINGKQKGGLVLDKMHLTVFYGLDYDLFDKKNLDNDLEEVKLGTLDLFYIKEFDCNALVLNVSDDDKKIQKFHEKLSKLDILDSKVNNFDFKPHITVAYVKSSFKLKNKEVFLGDILKVKKTSLKYH